MSEFDKKVECGKHGSSAATFVCQHLASGEKLGFNVGYDPEFPDDLYPDAWCNECEKMLESEGEWNEVSEKYADIKLLCSQCYEDLREKNWVQDDESLHNIICDGFRYLESKQKVFLEKYKINDHERWDWYQDSGLLIFTHNGVPQVEAEIHFSGSFSTKSNTWMWAWGNSYLDEKIKLSSRKIRSHGEKMGLLKLASGHWPGTAVDGWEMTAVLAKELNAIGAYRTPSDTGYTYMVVTKAKWLTKNQILGVSGENI
jgi:hypothetical protein